MLCCWRNHGSVETAYAVVEGHTLHLEGAHWFFNRFRERLPVNIPGIPSGPLMRIWCRCLTTSLRTALLEKSVWFLLLFGDMAPSTSYKSSEVLRLKIQFSYPNIGNGGLTMLWARRPIVIGRIIHPGRSHKCSPVRVTGAHYMRPLFTCSLDW